MKMIVLVAVLLAGVASTTAAAQAPRCHPLGKGMSWMDMDGQSETVCWNTTVMGGIAHD